jgi:hypothetical protein
MAILNTIEENSQPINWNKDEDELIIRKINARIDDAKALFELKLKDWKEADAYLDGDPAKVDYNKQDLIYNPLFPIVRNMTGLVTDSKPNPAARVTDYKEEEMEDKIFIKAKQQVADTLSSYLEEWWDNNKGQSLLQRWVMGLWTYADFYVFPFWDSKRKKVGLESLKPSRVKIDPNADGIDDADYVVVTFYKSRQWMYGRFGEKKCKDISFADYSELKVDEDIDLDNEHKSKLKNVCRLELYMECDRWCYKVDNHIIEKMRNPLFAPDKANQVMDIKSQIEGKYKKDGLRGKMSETMDKVKGMVGMETNQDKISSEVEEAMSSFEEKTNYFTESKIPIIHFDTYRLAGELYSRSVLKQSIRILDDLNDRKHDIKNNSEELGKPNIFIDGKIQDEEQAKRIKSGKAKGEIVRLNTRENRPLQQSVWIAQGIPVPSQFFDSIEIEKRELDNLWGHHEVSRGGSDNNNKTKGGILALQEADQTPIRYVVRNIEDALQELFEWVVQIEKMYKGGKSQLDSGQVLDWSQIDSSIKIFMKSGSMMPVSKEQQRDEAIELWGKNALDPLSLFERLNDSDPEKTAKRLEAWMQSKTILTDDMYGQIESVKEQIKLIKANQFEQAMPKPEDDPKVHHDMLLMALQQNQFTPEQEQFVAQLIEQYVAMIQGGDGQGQMIENNGQNIQQ